MNDRRRNIRYKTAGAWAAWDRWTFWNRVRRKRFAVDDHRHELLNIGLGGLSFATIYPPGMGAKILLSVLLPGETHPFTTRAMVVGLRLRKKDRLTLVHAAFEDLPEMLSDRIRQLGSTII